MNFWNIARPEESPVLKKTLSIMRLTTLFSIACSLQISASVYSQETKLSLDVNNQTIKEVLFKIEKQSGFRFIYESEKVNLNKESICTCERADGGNHFKASFRRGRRKV